MTGSERILNIGSKLFHFLLLSTRFWRCRKIAEFYGTREIHQQTTQMLSDSNSLHVRHRNTTFPSIPHSLVISLLFLFDRGGFFCAAVKWSILRQRPNDAETQRWSRSGTLCIFPNWFEGASNGSRSIDRLHTSVIGEIIFLVKMHSRNMQNHNWMQRGPCIWYFTIRIHSKTSMQTYISLLYFTKCPLYCLGYKHVAVRRN